MLRAIVGEAVSDMGPIVVCEVDDPFPHPPRYTTAYAAIVSPSARYGGPAVAMVVTVKRTDLWEACHKEGWVRPDEPRFEPWVHTVENVFADFAFRYETTQSDAAVTFGRFLRDRGAFRAHSSSRSIGGTGWAKRVEAGRSDSYPLPTNSQPVVDAKFAPNGRSAINKLNEGSWWEDLRPTP